MPAEVATGALNAYRISAHDAIRFRQDLAGTAVM